MKVQFFTTLGCHLCEQAEQLLAEVQASHLSELHVESVDIADDSDLFDRYGIRIPVIKRTDSTADLGWPFNKPDLLKYLE